MPLRAPARITLHEAKYLIRYSSFLWDCISDTYIVCISDHREVQMPKWMVLQKIPRLCLYFKHLSLSLFMPQVTI